MSWAPWEHSFSCHSESKFFAYPFGSFQLHFSRLLCVLHVSLAQAANQSKKTLAADRVKVMRVRGGIVQHAKAIRVNVRVFDTVDVGCECLHNNEKDLACRDDGILRNANVLLKEVVEQNDDTSYAYACGTHQTPKRYFLEHCFGTSLGYAVPINVSYFQVAVNNVVERSVLRHAHDGNQKQLQRFCH